MLKQRVMDDLDALLADLQSTTSHISDYQHQNHNGAGGTVTTSTHSTSHVHESGHASPGLGYQSKEGTPPPVPPPPSSEALGLIDNNLNIQHDPHYDSPAVVKQQYSMSKSSSSVTHTHSSGPAPPLLRPIQGVRSPPQIQRKNSPGSQHQPVNDGYDVVTPVSPHHQHRSPASPSQRRTPPPLPNQHKPVMSSLSNNLSELDSLLQDLSSAQFIAEVDRRNAENMTVHSNATSANSTPVISQKAPQAEKSVDSLLADLEHTISEPPQQWNNSAAAQDSLYEQVQVRNIPPQAANAQVMGSPGYSMAMVDHGGVPAQHSVMMNHSAMCESPGPASTATRELEDLMNSLSEFKVTSNRLQHVGDPPYAQPMKARQHANMKASQQTAPHMATVQGAGATASSVHAGGDQQHIQQDGGNLDSMLGTLNTDMSKQGITTVPKGHCALCMKPIVGQVITALGKIWHPEHFVCAHCDQQLGTQNFFERDNLPYCELDYHTLFSPKCASCNGAILDKCVTALDKTWHPEHFSCATCRRQFGDDGFHEKDGKAYCRDDYYKLFAPKCGRCGHSIEDNYISALSRQWHPQCFSCAECNIPFGGGSFFDHDGLPYCETHYHARRGSLCACCHKPITGRCITAMYKKFHPEHFVCAFCLKQLNKGTFKEQNDKPYCHPCFTKLFG